MEEEKGIVPAGASQLVAEIGNNFEEVLKEFSGLTGGVFFEVRGNRNGIKLFVVGRKTDLPRIRKVIEAGFSKGSLEVHAERCCGMDVLKLNRDAEEENII